MRVIITISLIYILCIGCHNKQTNNNDKGLKIEKMKDLNHKKKYTNESPKPFFIQLNTIPYEIGLKNYSKDAEELTGEIIKQLDGKDGGEYFLMKLDSTLNYKEKNIDSKTGYLIIGGRFKQQPFRKEANKTTVNVAIVKDETLINDKTLNFDKAIFVGIGKATEIKK